MNRVVIWHPKIHFTLGEDLYYYLLTSQTSLKELEKDLAKLLAEYKIVGYCQYILFGQFDVLLRIWRWRPVFGWCPESGWRMKARSSRACEANGMALVHPNTVRDVGLSASSDMASGGDVRVVGARKPSNAGDA